MDAQLIARWQFGITTVYHFLFVPITIGLSMLVAVLQTIWYKTGNEAFLRLTKFYGKLFLINFAIGVVTGIVQEFQFGMNWSEYSRFVGDVFGAPLALEALLAFFLESTFIGLWIFGWDRLPKKLHLMTIYMAAIGTMLSAIFILAANSWMQNPVGSTFRNGRAELTDFGALFTNPVFIATFPHVITSAYMAAGGLVAGIAAWHLAKLNRNGDADNADRDVSTWRWAAKFGAYVLLVSAVLVAVSGDAQAKAMTHAQPMKMAAAEALWDTKEGAGFSIITVGSLDGQSEVFSIRVPKLLSFMGTGDFNGTVQGINDLKAQFEEKGFLRDDGSQTELQATYADELAQYSVKVTPNIAVTYWTFRLMIGVGMLGALAALWLLWTLRKGRNPRPSKLWTYAMLSMPFLPVAGISFGWIMAEMGRQPWLVAGVMPTFTGASPSVSTFEVLTSVILYTLLYGLLAVIEFGLIIKYTKKGLPEVAPVKVLEDEDAPLSFAY